MREEIYGTSHHWTDYIFLQMAQMLIWTIRYKGWYIWSRGRFRAHVRWYAGAQRVVSGG